MTAADLLPLLPWLVLLAGTIAALLLTAIRRHHGLVAGVSVAALVICLASLPVALRQGPVEVGEFLAVDGFSLYYVGLATAGALATCLVAYPYLEHLPERREEFYILLLAATLGAATLSAGIHAASLFLGLEVLSISLFALVAYPAAHRLAVEAGIKYLVLAGLSSALLAFGLALLYYRSGSLAFAGLGGGDDLETGLLFAGNGLLLAGLAFKLSLAPFHLWAPDVYEGGPAPAVGFLATVSKGAVAALLLRYLGETGLDADPTATNVLSVLALLSIAVGNFLALLQDSLKRLLAYSSIAHLGYLLVAYVAGGPFGQEAVAYYLAAYFAMNLGAFGVIAALSPDPVAGDNDRLDDYRGLFWTRPGLAALLTLHLLSLAGIPLTAGFIAKFYLFASGVDAARWPLVAALVVGSVVGLFYYLRVVVALFVDARPAAPARPTLAISGGLALAVLALAVAWLGTYPQPAVELARSTRFEAASPARAGLFPRGTPLATKTAGN